MRRSRARSIDLPAPNVAHLWFGEPPMAGHVAEDWLADEERGRAARFRRERDRRLYVYAHVMLRGVLARYLAVGPRSLRFTASPGGRPEVLTRGVPPLRFSLTHTDGLAACLVTLAQDCGIDAELLDRDADLPLLAAATLAPAERRVWRVLPEEERRLFFFRRWTLKEAYLKARGLGLAVRPDEIAFVDRDGAPAREPCPGGDADQWRFWSFRPTPRHCAAAALRTGGAEGELAVFRLGVGPLTWR